MVRKRIFAWLCIALFPLFAWGVSPSASTYFVSCNQTANGTLDQFTVIFISVPDTINPATSFYIDINSPGGSTSSPDSLYNAGATTVYSVYGGNGAFSDPGARYLHGVAADFQAGTPLVSRSFTNQTTGWYQLPAIQVGTGEHIGNKYYFKLVVSATGGDNGKNAFQVEVSYASITDGTPTAPIGISSFGLFAYSWPLLLQDATSYNIFPFVPAGTTTYLTVANYDGDLAGVGAGTTGSLTHGGGLTISNDAGYVRNSFLASGFPNQSWQQTINSTVTAGNTNPTEFWAYINPTDDTTGNTAGLPSRAVSLVPVYASAVASGPVGDHMTVSPLSATLIANGTATTNISLVLVDSAGNLVNQSVKVYLSLDNGGIIDSSNSSQTAGSINAATALVTTDGFGTGWIKVKRNAGGTPVVSTLTVVTDGSNGSDNLPRVVANSNASITFTTTAAPSFSSTANQNFNVNTNSNNLAAMTVTDSGPAITNGNLLQIRIPASLNATFDTGVTLVTFGGTGSGNVNGTPSYLSANTIAQFSVTGNFTGGQTLIIPVGGLRLNTGSAGAGQLQFSWDGGATWVSDPFVITVSDPNLRVWTGAVSNDWSNANNWSPTTSPPNSTLNAIIPAGVSPMPSLTGVSQCKSLTIDAGATLSLGANGLTISGSFTNNGTLNAGTSTVTINGAGTLRGLSGTSALYNLTVNAAGTVTLASALELKAAASPGGTLALSAGTLDAAGFGITLDGNWTKTAGSFTANNNQVTFRNNGGQTAHAITGANTFYDLVSTAIATGSSITFSASTTTTINHFALLNGVNNTTGYLSLVSSSPNTQWTMDAQSVSPAMTFLSVTDSVRTTNTTPVPTNSISSNSSGWGLSASYTWKAAAASSSWSDGNNWTPFGVPIAGDAVTIQSSTNNPQISGSLNLASVTISSGRLDLLGFVLTTSTFSNSGTIAMDGSAGAQGFALPAGSGTTEFTTGGTGFCGFSSFYNLTISGGNHTAPAAINVTNALVVSGGSLILANANSGVGGTVSGAGNIDLSNLAGASTVTVGGNWSISSLTPGTGSTVVFSASLGAGPFTITPNGQSFYNLDINATGKTINVGGGLTVANNLAITAGTLDANGNDISIGGNFTASGTFSYGTRTVTMTGTGNISGLPNLYNLVVNAGYTTLGSNLNANSVDIHGGGTLELNQRNLSVSGSVFTSAGVGTLMATAAGAAEQIGIGGSLTVTTFTPANSVVTFNGTTGPNSCNSYTFYDLTIGSGAAITLNAAGNITVSHTLTRTSGIFAMAANTLFADGDISGSGASLSFTGAGTLDCNGSVAQSVNLANATLRNLTVDNSSGANPAVSVSSAFSMTGTLALTNGILQLANGNHTITGSVTGTAGALNASAISGGNSLSVTGNIGVFGTPVPSITAPASTLNLAGDWNVTTFVNSSGTVILTGTVSQTIYSSAANWNNLTISGNQSGTVTFNNALNVDGIFSVIAGAGAYNITINNGGTAAYTTSPVVFNNTGTLTIANGFNFDGGATAVAGVKSFGGTINAATNKNLDFGTTASTIAATATFGGTTGTLTLGATSLLNGVTLNIGDGTNPTIASIVSVTGPGAGSANLSIANTSANIGFSGTIGTNIGTIDISKSGGTATFSGSVTAATLNVNSNASAYNVAMSGGCGITTTTVFYNRGSLSLTGSATYTFAGGMASTGNAPNDPSSTTVSGTVQTNGQALAIGPLTLSGNSALSTINSAPAGGALSTGAITGAGFTLGVNSGTANTVTIAGGDNVSTLTITQSNGATISAPWGQLTPGIVTITNTQSGQTVDFQGNTRITTLNTTANPYRVSFTGSATTIANDATFLNTGRAIFGNNSADTITFTGGLDTTACVGGTYIDGIVSTLNQQIDLSALTLSGDSQIYSGSAATNIASATGAFNLSLGDNAQTGLITITGVLNNLGGITTFINNYGLRFNMAALGQTSTVSSSVTFQNTGSLVFGNDPADSLTFTGGASKTNAGTISFSGTVAAATTASLNWSPSTANALTLSLDTVFSLDSGTLTLGSGLADSTNLTHFIGFNFTGNGTVSITAAFSAANTPRYARFTGGGTPSVSCGANLAAVDVYFDNIGGGAQLIAAFSARRLVLYSGNFNINGRAITTVIGAGSQTWWGDFVAFGPAYSANDADRAPANAFFAYPDYASLVYTPNNAGYTAATGAFTVGPSATCTTSGSINATGNFYVNGMNLNTGAFGLTVAGNNAARPGYLADLVTPAPAYAWGLPYAIAFNLSVAGCTVGGTGVICAPSAIAGVNNPTNNNVINLGGNTLSSVAAAPTQGWNFVPLGVNTASTQYDDVILVDFNQYIKNGNGEISAALASIHLGSSGGTEVLNGAFTDVDCTAAIPNNANIKTFYVRANSKWNTDATGSSAGNTAGTVKSTDRTNTTRSITTAFYMAKGLLHAAGGKGHSVVYGFNSLNAYTGTSDACPPILVAVSAGRALHDNAAPTSFDGHNYLTLRYSEPVSVGNLTVAAAPVRAQSTFASTAQHGGEMSGAGTVTIANFASYPGTIIKASRDATPEVDSIAQLDNWRVRVYVAGYSSAGVWPGYVTSITDPTGAAITRLSNNYITDAAGNPVSTNSPVGHTLSALTVSKANDTLDASYWASIVNTWLYDWPSVAALSWDIYPPRVAMDTSILPGSEPGIDPNPNPAYNVIYQIYTLLDAFLLIKELDYVMTKPIRDSSWNTALWSYFGYGDYKTQPVFENNNNLPLNTQVTNPSPYNVVNDEYFSGYLNNAGGNSGSWGTTTSLFVNYTATGANGGFITDWAGNLMASKTGMLAKERSPANIRLSLGVVGGKRLFIEFDKPVAHLNPMTPSVFNVNLNPLTISDFTVTDGGGNFNNPTNITILETNVISTTPSLRIGASKIYVDLANPITADMVLNYRINGTNSIIDKSLNQMSPAKTFPLSNVGINLVVPTSAVDDIVNPTWSPSITPLFVFNGAGSLTGQGIINLTATKTSPFPAAQLNLPVSLYFDVGIDAALRAFGPDSYWYPQKINGLIANANGHASVVSGTTTGANTIFQISGEKFGSKDIVEFVLSLNGLPLAWTDDPNDPRSLKPWSFHISNVATQRGGVTILNNVINPTIGDKSLIQYSVPSPGMVSIIVMTIDGNVVRVLQSGQQAASEKYQIYWDGKNQSGNIVARGLYLIRCVGPKFDEIRKVMVVKP